VLEIEKEMNHWKEECEGAMVENVRLRSLYEKLLKHTIQENADDSTRGHQTIVELQEELHLEQVSVQQWKTKCKKWNHEMDRWKSQCTLLEIEVSKLKEKSNELAEKLNKMETNFELECYRAEAKIRKHCKACEE